MSAAAARQALAESDEAMRNGQEYAAERALQRAQVLATIAVAEEQRTANLIALFDEEGPEVFQEPTPTASRDVPYSLLAADRQERIRSRYLVLAADVAERLDLA